MAGKIPAIFIFGSSYPSPARGGGWRAKRAGWGRLHENPTRLFATRRATLPCKGRDKKAGKHHHPYSLRRRVRRSPFSVPRIKRGDGAPSGASCSVSHTFSRRCGASRRAIAASYGTGPRFRRRRRPAFGPPARPLLGSRAFTPRAGRAARPSASSSRRVIVPAGRSPGAAREGEERSSPPRGRRILLHHQDASRRRPHTSRTRSI